MQAHVLNEMVSHWTDVDGERTPIADLSDAHLRKALKLLLNDDTARRIITALRLMAELDKRRAEAEEAEVGQAPAEKPEETRSQDAGA